MGWVEGCVWYDMCLKDGGMVVHIGEVDGAGVGNVYMGGGREGGVVRCMFVKQNGSMTLI